MIPTSTSVYSDLSTVSSSVFTDLNPFLIVVIGLMLTFFIIESIIDFVSYRKEKKSDEYIKKVLSESSQLLKD